MILESQLLQFRQDQQYDQSDDQVVDHNDISQQNNEEEEDVKSRFSFGPKATDQEDATP